MPLMRMYKNSVLCKRPVSIPMLALAAILVPLALWRQGFEDFILDHYILIAVANLVALVAVFFFSFARIRKEFSGVKKTTWIAAVLIIALAFYLRYNMFLLETGGVTGIYVARAMDVFLFKRVFAWSLMGNYPVLAGSAFALAGPALAAIQNFNLLLNSLACFIIFLIVLLITKKQMAAVFACFLAAVATQSIILAPLVPAHSSFFFISLSALFCLLYVRIREPRILALAALSLTFTFGLEIENVFLLVPFMLLLFLHRRGIKVKPVAVPLAVFLIAFAPLLVWYVNYDRMFLCGNQSCTADATQKFPTIGGREAFLGTFYLDAFPYKFPRTLESVMAFPHFYDDYALFRFGEPLAVVGGVAMSNVFLLFLLLIGLGAWSLGKKDAAFFLVWLLVLFCIESFAWQHDWLLGEMMVAFYPALIVLASAGLSRAIKVAVRWRPSKGLEAALWTSMLLVTAFSAFSPAIYAQPGHFEGDFPYMELQWVNSWMGPKSCVLLADPLGRIYFYDKTRYDIRFTKESLTECKKIYYLDYGSVHENELKAYFDSLKAKIERDYSMSFVMIRGPVMVYEVKPLA